LRASEFDKRILRLVSTYLLYLLNENSIFSVFIKLESSSINLRLEVLLLFYAINYYKYMVVCMYEKLEHNSLNLFKRENCDYFEK